MLNEPEHARDLFGLRAGGVTFVATAEAWRLAPTREGMATQLFLFCIAFIAPVVVLISPQAIQITFVTACLFAAAALVLRPNALARLRQALASPYAVIGLAFIAYIALANVRSDSALEQTSSRNGAIILVSLVSVAIVFLTSSRDAVYRLHASAIFNAGMFLGLTSLVLLTVWEYLAAATLSGPRAIALSKDLTDTNRAIEILSIFVFLIPVTAAAARYFFASWLTLFLTSFMVLGVWSATGALAHVDSDTAQIGMPIALAVYVAARIAPKLAPKAVFAGLASLMLVAPWFYAAIYKYGAPMVHFRRHLLLDRMEIWSGVSRSVRYSNGFEFLFGSGRDALRVIGNFSVDGASTKVMPFHPHNMLLQLWLDLGLIGVLFVLAFLYRLYRYVQAAPAERRPALLATLVMAFIAASVTRSLWHVWYLSVLMSAVLLILIFSAVDADGTREGREPR